MNGEDHYEYDEAGRNHYFDTFGFGSAVMSFDGDGRQSKTVETSYDEQLNEITEASCYIRSTLLGGQVIAEVNELGSVGRRFVFAGPSVFADFLSNVGYGRFQAATL